MQDPKHHFILHIFTYLLLNITLSNSKGETQNITLCTTPLQKLKPCHKILDTYFTDGRKTASLLSRVRKKSVGTLYGAPEKKKKKTWLIQDDSIYPRRRNAQLIEFLYRTTPFNTKETMSF